MLLINGRPALVGGAPASGPAAAGVAPTISGVPTISGTAQVGQTLTATAASYSAGTPTPTTTWQWVNSVSGDISGATSSTYTVQASDEGDTITVRQIGTNASGSDTATSSATGTVAAAVAELIRIGTTEADGATTQYDSQYTLAWTDGTYPLGGSGGQVVVSGGVGTFTGTRTPGQYVCGNRTVEVDANYWVVGDQAQMNISAIGKTVIARKAARVTFDQNSAWGGNGDMQGTVLTQDGPDMRGDPLLNASNDVQAGYDHIVLRRCMNVTVRDCHIRPVSDGTTGLALQGNYGGTPALGNVQIERIAMKLYQADPEGDYNETTGTTWPAGGHGIHCESNMEIRGLSMRDNHIYGARYGIRVFMIADWPIENIGNHIDCSYEDLIQGNTAIHGAWLQAGNYKTRPLGLSSDKPSDLGPHSDGTQLSGSSGTTAPDSSITFEAEWTNTWNGRGSGNQGIFLADYSGSVGQEVLIRGGGSFDIALRSVSISNPVDTTVKWFGAMTLPSLSLPSVSGFSGGLTIYGDSTTDIEDCFAGNADVSTSTVTGSSLNLRSLTTAAYNAALPSRPADTTAPLPTLQEFMAMFEPAAAGAVDGMGPFGKVFLADGAERSEFTLDASVVNPTLTSVSASGGSGTFTASFRTDTAMTPVFWVLEPSGTVLTDHKDIKFARSGTYVERGITPVHKDEGDGVTDISIVAPTGIAAGTYELIFYQENGWTKESAIQSQTITIS